MAQPAGTSWPFSQPAWILHLLSALVATPPALLLAAVLKGGVHPACPAAPPPKCSTETTQRADIATDLDTTLKAVPGLGNLHNGFFSAYEAVHTQVGHVQTLHTVGNLAARSAAPLAL